MKKVIIILCLAATPAGAQNYGFEYGYNAATNGYNNGMRNNFMMQQMRANEAMINLERRRQGLPPCTLAPLRALITGEPAC